MPIFSSDHASERVRGIEAGAFLRYSRRRVRLPCAAADLRQERLQIRIGGRRSSPAGPSKTMPPSFSMMNSASSAFCWSADLESRSRPSARSASWLADEERVAQLVRHDDRADALEVAQLDDLLVDRHRRDRVEAGRRLVVEQDARLGGHRARDRDAPPLPAGQLRRHPVDELAEADEAEHLLARARRPRRRAACRLLEQLVADVLARRSASRRARPPGTPSRGRRAPPSARPRSSGRRARR